MTRLITCLVGFLFAVTFSNISRAEELPLWEAGFGFAGLTIPDYRGSDQQRGYLFPLPYLIYRGDILKIDRKGVYSQLFQSERVEVNISMDAGVPVRSGSNSTRSGMPDLDPTVQIGPAFEFCLLRACGSEREVRFSLPIRVVIATNLYRTYGIGFVANPRLNFDFKNIGPGGGWNFGFAFGPLFATEQYHEYYYEVLPQYAVSSVRPAYEARGGYSGSLLIAALSKRFDHVWFGVFARYDELSGAVFEDSPLVKNKHSLMAGFGFAWVFGQSRTLVHASQ